MFVYRTDDNSIWTGESREVAPKQGRHRREIPHEPPALAEGQYAQWRGHVWVVLDEYPPEPAPTPEQVNAERDRRLALDFTFAGQTFQRDAVSVQRISGAATLAGFAIAAGAQPGDLRWHGGSTDFAWIASDNTLVTMDAQTAFAFGQACANVETRLIFAAKALREMEPIPSDYTDDKWWP